jgi:hypothetical protein
MRIGNGSFQIEPFLIVAFRSAKVAFLRLRGCELFVGCDKRSEFQGGVPARAIIEVGRRPRNSQISAPAHREPCSARLSHPTACEKLAVWALAKGRRGVGRWRRDPRAKARG